MGDLPEERVRQHPPFQNCGVDYFGPVPLAHRCTAYGVLFCCLATRAVHLEWAPSASAAGFILAWRRFIARRGRPQAVWSDCASNFRLAERALKLADRALAEHDEEFDNMLADNSILWHYSTPIAPWQGGLYERLIRNTKEAFKRALGRKVLTLEEFITMLAEIETTVNSRPLVYAGEGDRLVLRPLDFLLPAGCKIGFPSLAEWSDVVEDGFNSSEKLLANLAHIDRLLEAFWQQWSSSYLDSLRQRTQTHRKMKRGEAKRGPALGEVVIIADETPRACWKMGRIVELLPGTDGLCRAAKVKTAAGRILQRHVSALHPLEVESPPETYGRNTHPQPDDTEQQAEDAPPEKTGSPTQQQGKVPPRHKYYTRQAKRRGASFFTIPMSLPVLMAAALIFLQGANGRECSEYGELIYEPRCGPGYKIFDNGEPCWTSNDNQCYCDDWLECSPYNGTRTAESSAERPLVRQWLRANLPRPCSWTEPGGLCASDAVHQDYYKVLLYDGSSHLLTNLQLRKVQTGEVQCMSSSISGGSPEYCMKRMSDGDSVCSVESGKFCWLRDTGMLLAASGNFTVPIRAWALAAVDIYPYHSGAVCRNCSISCPQDRPGHVHVRGGAADLIEVIIGRRRTYLQMPAALEELSKPHRGRLEATMRAWKHGWLIADLKTMCPATQLCPKCLLCKARLANPFCDTWATTFLFMVLANAAGLIVAVAMLLVLCAKRKRRASAVQAATVKASETCPTATVTLIPQSVEEETEDGYEMPILAPRRPSSAPPPPPGPPPLPPRARRDTRGVYGNSRRSMRRRSYRPVEYASSAASVLLLLGFGLTTAIPSTRTTTIHSELCSDDKGTLECHFDTAVELVLKQHEAVRLALLGANNTYMGDVTLQLMATAKVCNAVAEFYTREALVQVQSRRLCPKEGSCSSELPCLRVQPTDKIPELGPLANDNPGVTACRGGSACWLQGCFWCSTTCTFWREYALPSASDTSIYRVVSCNSWTARYVMRLTTPDFPEGKEIQLESEYDDDHLSIRAESLYGPEIPLLYTAKFLVGDGRAALLSEARAQAFPLHCNSHHEARRFNCTLRSKCSCEWVSDSTSCNCPRHYVENVFAEEALPRHTPEMELEYWRDSVRAVYEVGDLRLRLKTRRLRAATILTNGDCTVQILSTVGCYSCHGGAEIEYRCDVNATGATRVAAQCGDSHFELECDASERTKLTHASFQNAVLNHNCTAWCPGKRSAFELRGVLNYVPEETEQETEIIISSPHNKRSEQQHDDHSVDWWAVWAYLKEDWRRTVAIGAGVLASFSIFPGLVTCLIKCGFVAGKRGAEACSKAMNKKPDQ